ncbi:MAG: hypothetical protein NVS3B10_00540 [Polyangiales bacterium]
MRAAAPAHLKDLRRFFQDGWFDCELAMTAYVAEERRTPSRSEFALGPQGCARIERVRQVMQRLREIDTCPWAPVVSKNDERCASLRKHLGDELGPAGRCPDGRLAPQQHADVLAFAFALWVVPPRLGTLVGDYAAVAVRTDAARIALERETTETRARGDGGARCEPSEFVCETGEFRRLRPTLTGVDRTDKSKPDGIEQLGGMVAFLCEQGRDSTVIKAVREETRMRVDAALAAYAPHGRSRPPRAPSWMPTPPPSMRLGTAA